jgi:formylmethanofuran dehydrogenase subunit E
LTEEGKNYPADGPQFKENEMQKSQSFNQLIPVLHQIQSTVIVECELCDAPQVIISDRSDGVMICRSCREEIARDDFHGSGGSSIG